MVAHTAQMSLCLSALSVRDSSSVVVVPLAYLGRFDGGNDDDIGLSLLLSRQSELVNSRELLQCAK